MKTRSSKTGAKSRTGGSNTSANAAANITPFIPAIKAQVLKVFQDQHLRDIGKPWNQQGITDYQLQCILKDHSSSKRTRRDELTWDDNLIVHAGYQIRVGKKLFNVWRLRVPSDPFYVPIPQDGTTSKKYKRDKIEDWMDGAPIVRGFKDESSLRAFLKHWRFKKISTAEEAEKYRTREDYVLRPHRNGANISVVITREPYILDPKDATEEARFTIDDNAKNPQVENIMPPERSKAPEKKDETPKTAKVKRLKSPAVSTTPIKASPVAAATKTAPAETSIDDERRARRRQWLDQRKDKSARRGKNTARGLTDQKTQKAPWRSARIRPR